MWFRSAPTATPPASQPPSPPPEPELVPQGCPHHLQPQSHSQHVPNDDPKHLQSPREPALHPDNLIPVEVVLMTNAGVDKLGRDRQTSTIPRCPKRASSTEEHTPPATCPAAHPLPSATVPAQTTGTPMTAASERTTPTVESGEACRWTYPSEQQFYRALERKGHATDVEDIPMILHLHNEMNERCWRDIERWERLHPRFRADCDITLKRFQGRPRDWTPKAFLMHHVWGAPKPFDRHDWIVDRCGEEVRYVIDYYGEQPGSGQGVMYVDARPAVDSLSAAVHRFWAAWQSQTPEPPSGTV